MDEHDAAFQQLIFSFQMQGLIALGKIMNPVTQKIERNLTIAQATIETLDALRVKTQGNLTEEEKELLDYTISDLKLNYVDELEREKQTKEGVRPEGERQETQKEAEGQKQASQSEKTANSTETSKEAKNKSEEKE